MHLSLSMMLGRPTPNAGGGVRASNNLFAVLGDSRMYQSTDGSFVTKQNNGYPFWAEFDSSGYAEFRPEWNYGVNGETSEQVLARVAAVSADVGTVVVLVSTNDRGNGWTAERSITALAAIRDHFNANGVATVFIAETPRGSDTWPALRLDATQLGYHQDVRNWCLAQYGTKRTRAIDLWDLWESPADSGDVLDGLTRDGLHQTVLGAALAGPLLASVFQQIMPEPDLSLFSPLAYPNGDWIGDNPQLTGSGGSLGTGGSGSMPTSWIGVNSTSETGLTRTYSANQCVVAGTPNTASAALFLYRSANLASRVSAGDILEAGCDLSWAEGLTGFRNIQLTLQMDGATSPSYTAGARAASDTVDMPSAARSGRLRVRGTVPASPTDVRLYIQSWHRQSVAASGTLTVNNLAFRKVG